MSLIHAIELEGDLRIKMVNEFDHGEDTSNIYPTGWERLDGHFKWLRGDINVLGGIGNHGKSTWAYQAFIQLSKAKGIKWAIFSPEQNPPSYFYADLAFTLLGKSIRFGDFNRCTKREFTEALDFVRHHFVWVYPTLEDPTPKVVFDTFDDLRKQGYEGFCIDPYNQLDHDWIKTGLREDQYLSRFLGDVKRWCSDVYFFILTHPTKLRKPQNSGDYDCPDVYDLAGGAMWNNKADNVLFLHRPMKTSDPSSTEVLLRIAKIKKQRLVGQPADITGSFDRATNRFSFGGHDGLTEINHESSDLPF